MFGYKTSNICCHISMGSTFIFVMKFWNVLGSVAGYNVTCFTIIPWYSDNFISWYNENMSYILGIVSQKEGFLVKIADLDTQQTTSTDWSSDWYENCIKPDIQV